MIEERQVGTGIPNLEGIERLTELGQGFVASWIRERMQADPQAMVVRFREDVGAGRGAVPACGTHASLLRADRALHALLGMKRFPTDGTMRNLFKRFTQGMVVRFYEPLWTWQLARLPKRAGGYSLDLDSTVFERYGEQEGVKKGYNPRKPGPGSHHPLLAVLGEAYFILHGWLRSGNTVAASGVVSRSAG